MRALLTYGAGTAILLWTVCASAHAQTPECNEPCTKVPYLHPCPAPCDSSPTVINVPPPKVRVELSPPEVIIKQAAPVVVVPEKEGFLQRCCHFCSHSHSYNVPMAPTYQFQQAPVYSMAPVMAQPLVMPMAPAAPAYMPAIPAYAPMAPVYAPSAPVYAPSAPVYAPSAPVYAPSAPVYAPSAPAYMPAATHYVPSTPSIPYCPPCPGQSPTAPAAPAAPANPTATTSSGGTELNDVLKKLSGSVDLLTKSVRQQTKILEFHENRLDEIEGKLSILENKYNTHTHTLDTKKTSTPDAPQALPKGPPPIGPGGPGGPTGAISPNRLNAPVPSNWLGLNSDSGGRSRNAVELNGSLWRSGVA